MSKDLNPIIVKVLQGDKEQFRNIIRYCNQPLYRTALIILKNESDAEDVLQTTYLKAYQHLHSFRREATFLTWITRILINECKMMMRGKKLTTSIDHLEVLRKSSDNESVMDTLYNKQIQTLLEQAVMRLPEKYKLVYIVREVNEMSTAETASALGLSEEAVKVRLHRAKSLIRENLLQRIDVHELFPIGGQRCDHLAGRVMQEIMKLSVLQ
jgi:RNA polymerase sigma-70 factor (ECF subfamily)